MKKFWNSIKQLIWPGANASLPRRILPYSGIVFFGLLALVVSVVGWEYTNSTSFCGTICHTMPPQYLTYLRSPHSRVGCVECHLGREIITTQLPRKLEHTSTVYALIFNTYEFPIVAKKMRPASEACETCHYPRQFSDDNLREMRYHESDEANSLRSTFLVMKIGGGARRSDQGHGIHWHIGNKVTFIATDELQQNIPYIRWEDESGKVKEYYDLAGGITPENVGSQKQQAMDCITCHNRDAHAIPSPAQTVDNAMFQNSISDDLPFLRKQAVDLLSADYPDFNAAKRAFSSIESYYQEKYPEVYSSHRKDIRQAILFLENAYQQIRFPEQKMDWTSHPDNLGHKDSPGCFRCHDGKHISPSGEAIRLECNLCHSIPVPSDPSKYVTDIRVLRGAEPLSHTSTHWIAIHGKALDSTCARCHPPLNPTTDYSRLSGKKPPLDGSFCGNTACHASEWKFTGFRNPALKNILDNELKSLPPAPR
ncbi:MAG TPA: NapC/NirT family cytochrome c [Anaerolineaceae bacterium]